MIFFSPRLHLFGDCGCLLSLFRAHVCEEYFQDVLCILFVFSELTFFCLPLLKSILIRYFSIYSFVDFYLLFEVLFICINLYYMGPPSSSRSVCLRHIWF